MVMMVTMSCVVSLVSVEMRNSDVRVPTVKPAP